MLGISDLEARHASTNCIFNQTNTIINHNATKGMIGMANVVGQHHCTTALSVDPTPWSTPLPPIRWEKRRLFILSHCKDGRRPSYRSHRCGSRCWLTHNAVVLWCGSSRLAVPIIVGMPHGHHDMAECVQTASVYPFSLSTWTQTILSEAKASNMKGVCLDNRRIINMYRRD